MVFETISSCLLCLFCGEKKVNGEVSTVLVSFKTPLEPRPLESLAALTRVLVDPARLGTILASRPQENMKRDVLSYGAPVPESAAQHWGVKGKLVGGVCG